MEVTMSRSQFRNEIYHIMCIPSQRPIIKAIVNKAGYTRLSDVLPEHYTHILSTYNKVKK
jgi:hypothetical protein